MCQFHTQGIRLLAGYLPIIYPPSRFFDNLSWYSAFTRVPSQDWSFPLFLLSTLLFPYGICNKTKLVRSTPKCFTKWNHNHFNTIYCYVMDFVMGAYMHVSSQSLGHMKTLQVIYFFLCACTHLRCNSYGPDKASLLDSLTSNDVDCCTHIRSSHDRHH